MAIDQIKCIYSMYYTLDASSPVGAYNIVIFGGRGFQYKCLCRYKGQLQEGVNVFFLTSGMTMFTISYRFTLENLCYYLRLYLQVWNVMLQELQKVITWRQDNNKVHQRWIHFLWITHAITIMDADYAQVGCFSPSLQFKWFLICS